MASKVKIHLQKSFLNLKRNSEKLFQKTTTYTKIITMNNKLIALTLGVAVAGLIGFFFFNDKEETPIVAQKTPVILEALIEEDQPQEQKIIVKVIYTAEGFSPKTVELSVGDSIEFANKNTRDMWVGGNSQ